MKYWRIIW